MSRGWFTVVGAVGAVAALMAASTVWLVLQEPVMVADAISTGRYSPLFSALTQQVAEWVRALATVL